MAGVRIIVPSPNCAIACRLHNNKLWRIYGLEVSRSVQQTDPFRLQPGTIQTTVSVLMC